MTREDFKKMTKEELCQVNFPTFLHAHSADLKNARIYFLLNHTFDYTVGEFCNLTSQQIRQFQGVGHYTAMLIEDILAKYGLHFAQPEEQPMQETDTTKPTQNPLIDWEQRRYETGRAILAAYIACNQNIFLRKEEINHCIGIATIFIEELKGEQQ